MIILTHFYTEYDYVEVILKLSTSVRTSVDNEYQYVRYLSPGWSASTIFPFNPPPLPFFLFSIFTLPAAKGTLTVENPGVSNFSV